MIRRSAVAAAAMVAALAIATGCAGGSPDVPVGPDGRSDPVLGAGRAVYERDCARCHGPDGGGGFGPKLSEGVSVEVFPDPDLQAAVIADGRAGMPGFGEKLDSAEIEAVVRYTREVL